MWSKTGNDAGMLVLTVIIFICFIYFNIVADVRRLHDIGESGWWVFLKLVPLANIVIAAFLFLKVANQLVINIETFSYHFSIHFI